MENHFRIKEINAEERVTFRNKVNSRDVQQNKFKVIIRHANFVRGTFPKRKKKVKRRNLASSRVLYSFTDTQGCALRKIEGCPVRLTCKIL